MKAILGILPSTGEASLAGVPITCSEDLVGKVGFAPQFTAAQAQLTVGESLDYALRLAVPSAADRRTRLEGVLDVTGLKPHRNKRVSSLSGGQLRRLSLGLELTLDPACMVCDEVTSGLDPQSEDQILALLRDLATTRDKSFVCIIHNLGKLYQFDWVTVVYQGDVVFQGSPQALLGYFKIPDGLGLYEVLNASDLATWRDRWAIHQAEHPGAFEAAAAAVGTSPEPEPLPEPVLPGGVSQFCTLLARRLRLFFRDTGYLGLTLAITFGFPLLVVIFNFNGVWNLQDISLESNPASVSEFQARIADSLNNARVANMAAGLVMFQVILLTLMGANNGGREISAERQLYEKERMTGLRPWSYALSKITFVSLIAVFQGVWMCVFVKLICCFPGGWAPQLGILVASCVSMSVVCLAFSALLASPEKSSLLSIYLVGFQLPLSGVVLALPDQLTWVCRPFINSYWGWSGFMKSMADDQSVRLWGAYVNSLADKSAQIADNQVSIMVLSVHAMLAIALIMVGCQQKRWN